MYFLSWSEPLSVKLRAMGFDRVDSFPFNLNLMRASSDPAKLAAWVLPYRRTVAKGSDLVLHRIPDRPLVRLEPGQRIMMSEAGLGYLLVQEGWSGQEVSARWTEGKKARLTLPISNDVWPDSPLRLTLFASTFQPQTVEFFVGGKLLQRRRLGPTPEEITLDIQFDAIRDGKLDLILLLPDAHSPKSAGTDGDARELGLSLRWIRFDPK